MAGLKLYAADIDFHAIAEEFQVRTEFPAAVHQEAAQATDQLSASRTDYTEIPFVTIDPPGSMDLDQAVHITRNEEGYVVRYAIADVAAFVDPDGALAAESYARGQTIYLPDTPARLHPAEISEDKASLLPGVERPAVLWTIHLDSAGEVSECTVERARVQSVARLDYQQVSQQIAAGTLPEAIQDLAAVGQLRVQSRLRRQAITLRLPSQIVVRDEQGQASLRVEPRVDSMDYNSEISLLAGMCAGTMMAKAGMGILRTLPSADARALSEFAASATALGFHVSETPTMEEAAQLLSACDPDTPAGMALMREAQKLLRGAGYGQVTSPITVESELTHAGVGGFYAHVTAPLRRLVDRFATEYCLSICQGTPVPAWVEAHLETVLATMRSSSHLASQVDRACLDLTEAVVLEPWVGQNFSAIVLDTSRIFVEHPPVFSSCVGNPPTAQQVLVTLVNADTTERRIEFAWPAD